MKLKEINALLMLGVLVVIILPPYPAGEITVTAKKSNDSGSVTGKGTDGKSKKFISAPGVALVLLTLLYFIAVVAVIVYTNKKIKKDGNNYEEVDS